MKDAIVLLSGGLDSATVLYMALESGYRCRCLIFDYGQRHRKEIARARKIAKKAGCAYRVIKLPFPWRASALLDKKADLPSGRSAGDMAGGIPSTYVPLRNTIFLSMASGWAEAIGAEAVFIGANAVDFSGYPDCHGAYFEAFDRLLEKGSKIGAEGRPIKIKAPLLEMKKSEIIASGAALKVPYELTWSCYKGAKAPCGECDACVLREKGFREAGLEDPIMGRRDDKS